MTQMMRINGIEKKQKNQDYAYRTSKLEQKDNNFSRKKFQRIREDSTQQKLLESLARIATCLNFKAPADLPIIELDKVCLLIMNDFDEQGASLGVGPLNDGYLIELIHHRLDYKVFYLYNSGNEQIIRYINFFMQKTISSLTIFFSGESKTLSKNEINNVISTDFHNNNHILFITDSIEKGSIFEVEGSPNKVISFSVEKDLTGESKAKRSHGIFTYYFSKIINEYPNITPSGLVEKINPLLERFNESFTYQSSNKELIENSIFPTK